MLCIVSVRDYADYNADSRGEAQGSHEGLVHVLEQLL